MSMPTTPEQQRPASHKTLAEPARPREGGQMRDAIADVFAGLRRWRVAAWLGWRDAIVPMRKTIIGPFWITIQSALWVVIIVSLLGANLGAREPLYPLYVAAGVVVFQFITSLLVDGAAAFTREASLIQNIPIPFTIYLLRVVFKSLIVLGVQLPIILGALFFVPDTLSVTWFLAIPSIGVIIFVMFGVSLLLASIAPFFRDIPFALGAILRVMFFATPIFWLVDGAIGARQIAVQYNPLAHLLSLVREPLLNRPVPTDSLALMLVAGTFMWLVGLVVFARTRTMIASNL
ncbi:MAG: ABC transporter permease [Pseudomonadota bacterium]